MSKQIETIAKILLIIGGLNWLLIGALQFNLVETLLGSIPMIVNLIYVIVGLSAVCMVYLMSSKR